MGYDVIVVGAGLGGLAAAATLARAGKRVRLFEKHTQPGGYATTFFRDQFEFEVALHSLSGIGPPDRRGPLYEKLAGLGVVDRLDFVTSPAVYRSVGPELDVTVPPGREAALEALVRAFPGERPGLTRLLDQVYVVGEEIERLRASGAGTSPAVTVARFPNVAHAAGVPVSSLLYRELQDPGARLAFGALWGYFGLPPRHLSFLLFAAAMHAYIEHGGALIRQKSQGLANALLDVFVEAGGEASLAQGVEKISVRDGHVHSVVTDRGDEWECDQVVTNASPITTFGRLIDAEHVPATVLDALARTRPSLSSFCVYLGLDRPSRQVGIEDHEVYLATTLDMEEQYAGCFAMAAPKYLGICSYDAHDSAACPPGTGLVTLVTLHDGAMWRNINPHQYYDIKQRLADELIRGAEQLYPELGSSIQTTSVATPLTNIRYTGNPLGAIYGFVNTPANNPGFRMAPETPIAGLWLAGAWTQPGGGFQTCITSGMQTAQSILQQVYGEPRAAPPAPPRSRWLSREARDHRTTRHAGYRLIARDRKAFASTLATKFAGPALEGAAAPLKDWSDQDVSLYHPVRLPVRVAGKMQETDDTVTLRLQPVTAPLPPFIAGQYFNLFVNTGDMEVGRPYSVSSPPTLLGSIDITVKRQVTGLVSRTICDDSRVGDVLHVTGPAGDFHYDPVRDTPRLVGVAVGSGITPFMSIVEEIAARQRPVSMKLIYGSRTEESTIFRDRLERLAAANDWLEVVHVLSRPSESWTGERGRVDAEVLARHLDLATMDELTFFLCGPRELYRSLMVQLGELGVPRRRVRLESYGPPHAIEQERDWPRHVDRETKFKLTISGQNRELVAPAGLPILNALERAGHPNPAMCRSDSCDSCRVRLIEGEVYTPEDALGVRTGRGKDYIHACMCYPLSDIVIAE